MKNRWFACALAACAIAGPSMDATAASTEAVPGARTLDGFDCVKTFRKVGTEIQFIDRPSELTAGIIVSGSKIVGPNAPCTADRIREEKYHFSVGLNCSTAVMFDHLSVSFGMADEDSFERFDPAFPDVSFRSQVFFLTAGKAPQFFRRRGRE